MIEAVIFDMDGVISDTQKLHSQVESELLGRYGVRLTPQEITARYSGVRTADFFKELLTGKVAEHDIEGLMKEKHARMADLAREGVDPMPGAKELIGRLLDNQYRLAVFSASELIYVNTVLSKVGVLDKFEEIVSGDQVKEGKPDPEGYLLAADRLSVSPASCLVIEDGVSGMVAAKAAGMKCIGLVPSLEKKYPTEYLVQNLAEVTIDYVRRL